MNGTIVGSIVLLLIVGLYFGSFILNKNTAVPEGTQVIDKCSTCGSGSCSLSKKEIVSKSEEQVCEDFK